MQHGNKNRTFGRVRSQRTALMRGLAVSLIRDGKIKTTEAKAKELRPLIERLVTYGKKNTLSARRIVASRLGEPNTSIVKKVFDVIAPKFTERAGGYTRIIKMGRTPAGRDEAVIEFVE
ncbi:50S ribosomal protein L17 [Candidatus Kaiserbacteria bacterium RIFOXYD1_FULL_42_15]|uniref:50S ribosomal protein L17 n=1 Tax=Candidatus Kaiserbacteria bacterium RIFOXYD1_FULL_42_15 TaxID=1798532 RepID=A0A1F6FR63_9BACT|nr:MAG: 50S ribosomal protein L17 [Candidatus Kaiserbacteria bacterium RIFOXYD1_FULL_42_15]